MTKSKAAKSVVRIKPAAKVPQIFVDSPSQDTTLEGRQARANIPKNDTINRFGSIPSKYTAQARKRQASSEDVTMVVDSGRPHSVAIPATSGTDWQKMLTRPDSQRARMQHMVRSTSAREAAARKLAQLEAASADSLSELERLIEEQHYQVALLSPFICIWPWNRKNALDCWSCQKCNPCHLHPTSIP